MPVKSKLFHCILRSVKCWKLCKKQSWENPHYLALRQDDASLAILAFLSKKKIGGIKWKKNTSVFFPIDLFAYLRISSSSINTLDLFIYTFSYLIHISFSHPSSVRWHIGNTYLDSIGTAIGYFSFFLYFSILHFIAHLRFKLPIAYILEDHSTQHLFQR